MTQQRATGPVSILSVLRSMQALRAAERPNVSVCRRCGMPTVGHLCPQCTEAAELDYITGQQQQYMKGQVTLRRLPEIFAHWTTAPSELIAMNSAAWNMANPTSPEFFDPRSGHVFFVGTEGTGKTSLARTLMRYECLYRGATIAESSGAKLEEIARGFDCLDFVTALSHVRILLLDDLGNAGWSKRGLNTLRIILDTRQDLKKCTLITSNQDEAGLKSMFEKVIDENFAITTLRRLCPLKRVIMSGESYRKSLKYGPKK